MVRSMQKSQNQVIYQISTIWSHRKNIQRKRIPGCQLWWFNISKNLSARSIGIILTSQLWLLLLSTSYHWWLNQESDWQSSPLSFPIKSKDNQPIALINKLKRTEMCLNFILFWTNSGKFHAQYLQPHCMWLHVTARDFQLTFIKTFTFWLSSLMPGLNSLTF